MYVEPGLLFLCKKLFKLFMFQITSTWLLKELGAGPEAHMALEQFHLSLTMGLAWDQQMVQERQLTRKSLLSCTIQNKIKKRLNIG